MSDLVDEHQHVVAEERWLEGTHLVQDTAQGPDIRLLSVREVLYDLRAVWKQRLPVLTIVQYEKSQVKNI